jgi:hypothetical protein
MARCWKLALRLGAILMMLAAVSFGVDSWRQVQAADDGGPPLGAIFMALPAIALLLAAGAIWSAGRRD